VVVDAKLPVASECAFAPTFGLGTGKLSSDSFPRRRTAAAS
jgi:hypothetical protein